jgi:hypothetical protein
MASVDGAADGASAAGWFGHGGWDHGCLAQRAVGAGAVGDAGGHVVVGDGVLGVVDDAGDPDWARWTCGGTGRYAHGWSSFLGHRHGEKGAVRYLRDGAQSWLTGDGC